MVDDFSGKIKEEEIKSNEQKKVEWEDKNPEWKLTPTNQLFFYKFMTFIAVFGILIGSGFGIYYLRAGKFQSNINQPITINPLFNSSVSSQTINNYEHTIPVNLQLNVYIDPANQTANYTLNQSINSTL